MADILNVDVKMIDEESRKRNDLRAKQWTCARDETSGPRCAVRELEVLGGVCGTVLCSPVCGMSGDVRRPSAWEWWGIRARRITKCSLTFITNTNRRKTQRVVKSAWGHQI